MPAAVRPIYRISASGGTAIPLKLASPLEGYICWPQFLPDGRHFLVNVYTNGIYLISSDGNEVHALKNPKLESRAEYAAGYLFYGRDGSLFAQPFDVDAFAATGEPLRVAEDLGFSAGDNHHYAFSVSASGTLITSFAALQANADLGLLTIARDEVADFRCPILPNG